MPPVLVAADADRVQDLIFRSSRLREVTGASFALETFWSNAADLARDRWHGRVQAAAGGSIRVVFDHERAQEHAREFRRALEDLYAIETGGSLTSVLLPEAGHERGMDEAALLALAPEMMGRAKLQGRPATVSPHFPYLRPCDSCGRDLAATTPDRADPDARLCRICATRSARRDDYEKEFIRQLRKPNGITGLPEDANEVGGYDGRGRVAYLLADGNGFGVMFGAALERGIDVYTDLSRAVGEAGSRGIEAATAALIPLLPELRDGHSPVLPLISGGDDVFALLPARWAFWFAREFASAFVRHVGEAKYFDASTPAPTVSCALVFCKATFPYRFAHAAGEEALREAKRRWRDGDVRRSDVRAVEVRDTVGRDSPGPAHERAVFGFDGEGGDSVATLMKARKDMDGLPRKRLHQIEELYAAKDLRSPGWNERRKRLLERIGGDLGKTAATTLAGLDAWDEPSPEPPVDGESGETASKTPLTSAAVDLLHLWDYLADPSPAQETKP